MNLSRATVLLSVYNSARYIRAAVESILNQSFRDFEFLIYDDCSTDGTSEILQGYDDPRIVYIRNETNRGLVANLIDGVNRAKGEYIARMDGDDIALPDRLAKQVAWMDAHPDVTVLGSPVIYFNDENDRTGLCEQPTENEDVKAKLFINFTLMHPTIMIRRADLARLGINYQIEYKSSEDHRLYFDLLAAGCRFANFPEPLLKMRSHPESVTRAKPALTRTCADWARAKLLEHLGLKDRYTEEAVEAWNDVATGHLPKSVAALKVFDDFIDDFVNQESARKCFDVDVLRRTVANELKGIVYFRARERGAGRVSLAFFRTRLAQFADPWPMKLRVKFVIKLINGVIR